MIGPIKGDLKPLNDHVLATDMDFGDQRTQSGIIIPSDDGKNEGIRPRWCRVWKIGHKQKDVKVGDWILVEHGRWTRGVQLEQADGTTIDVRRIDASAIMAISDHRPGGIEWGTLTTHYSADEPEFNDLQRAF